MVICKLCSQKFRVISSTHLRQKHNISFREYKERFPKIKSCFPLLPHLLPKSDPRYQKWFLSLRKRPPVWNEGRTKETDHRVKKISDTFKKRKIDNFAKWRAKMVKLGRIRKTYLPFEKAKELAFFIGLVLGDGNITKFPRTECLTIALNAKYPGLIFYTYCLLEKFFEKQPSQNRIGNCVKLRVYQKQISKRLEVPLGNRRYSKVGIPTWVWESREYLIWCLKGLFEAEGSLSVHLSTCTYNFSFSNRNEKLLGDVGKALEILGLHPEYRSYATRLRKRKEVETFKGLIFFRKFNFAG